MEFSPRPLRAIPWIVAGIALSVVVCSPAAAQVKPPPPDTDYAPPPPSPPERIPTTRFVMPDVPDDWNKATTYDGHVFSTRLYVVPLIDYSAFTQDADSVHQVGKQVNQWDLRTFRIMTVGEVKTRLSISYMFSLEIKGKDHVQTGDSSLGFTDWSFGVSLGRLGNVRYGKIKEPFVYELVADSANLAQQERILSPFFVTRGTGVRWSGTAARDRLTMSAGWFNRWWIEGTSFTSTANDYAARLTGLPIWSGDGANYIHLGISHRHAGADNGSLRFRGRPESNTTSYYVDSSEFTAVHAEELGLEALAGRGPYQLATEYVQAWVNAPAKGDPTFRGTYLTLSYFLTGEHRPYDRKVGYARRVQPQGRWGAWETFGRYTHLDIDDQFVAGGVLDKGTLGINWWATRRWKLGFDYGLSDLDRSGVHGTTNGFHARVQWVY